MAQQDIRVLIVDDSAVIRAILRDLISAAPGLCVAGAARNGAEAVEKIASLHPDVVTLDVQMPDMDGLAVLDRVFSRAPVPVIMVSSTTVAGAVVTLDALDRGAIDYVAKPERGCNDNAFAEELLAKIRAAAGVDIQRTIAARRNAAAHAGTKCRRLLRNLDNADLGRRCVALGVSTGGPPALTRLLGELQPPMPPMVVVQHMPAQFTAPLAARLDSYSSLTVREAAQGDVLEPNCVFIAPGDKHLEITRRGELAKLLLRDGASVSGHKPSVDVMMRSAAGVFGSACLGVIMTGMGRDGVEGCRAIRANGGYVLGQDESSSDVYGMNKAAYLAGCVHEQFPLAEAARFITRCAFALPCVAPAKREHEDKPAIPLHD